ncbi:[FeFe] hydrogenase H-cluster maturation GTPase HydF [Clostridia bacterium]|nr:[FeFe] hydrogenase H-cluster maturation GTPase HydF [Clostridia bacterium]
MSLNATPSSERVHIGFFGKRNVGKSTVVNAVTGQNMSVVSPVKGTTTDPVRKSMELLPLGPVVIIDTPGIDDSGELGSLRVEKTRNILEHVDIAVLIADASEGLSDTDRELIKLFDDRNVAFIVAYNKSDTLSELPVAKKNEIYVSARDNVNITELKELIASVVKPEERKYELIGDLISPSDFVVLVTPIDSAAPKGRMILPQQQVIRAVLEADAAAIVVQENRLLDTLENLGKKPSLVVTDSQAFAKVSAGTPLDIPLTSFSILFARYKGLLGAALSGVNALDALEGGAKVLICEGCTHHRQCDDIGTVKLPRWIREYTGKDFEFSFTSGGGFPEDLSPYELIVHCGGCMLNDRAIKYRMRLAEGAGVPITNYGTLIAHMQGILERSTAMLGL